MRTLRTRLERQNHAGPSVRRGGLRTGFTLIELLVVVGIIAILAALITPAIIGAMRRAQETETLNLIHQVEIAAQAYFNDRGDYPPSTWAELDEFLRYDSTRPGGGPPDGVYNRLVDEVFFAFPPGPPDAMTNPSTLNEGIEVLTACLATQNGGPYLEPGAQQIGNTDGDTDAANHAAAATNWYFAPNTPNDPVFELVDYWGNPLVYIHNRDYALLDGVIGDVGGIPDYEDPTVAGVEFAPYEDSEHDVWPCYARSHYHMTTLNYPNLSGYQLYSWGPDLRPGRAFEDAGGNVSEFIYPGWAGASHTGASDLLNGTPPPRWVAGDGNLVNWQE